VGYGFLSNVLVNSISHSEVVELREETKFLLRMIQSESPLTEEEIQKGLRLGVLKRTR
jgi:hypothetical protein